jgi:L-methionine (R)-S-oxide reductase
MLINTLYYNIIDYFYKIALNWALSYICQPMAEIITLPKNTNKTEVYKSLIPQIEAVIKPENNLIANLANVSAILKEAFNFFWVGFYLVDENQLVLGPFQGPLACTRIQLGKGVCGSSWQKKQTLIVPDVEKFPGHIACSALSKSEIVVPAINQNNQVVFVLDVDSEMLNNFNKEDQNGLEQIVSIIVKKHF